MTMNEWRDLIHQWAHTKGFYKHEHSPTYPICQHVSGALIAQIMLVVTELSEAVEAVRKADVRNFKEEIADSMIRLLDLCGACNIDIDEEVREKMQYNETRPERHGKEF